MTFIPAPEFTVRAAWHGTVLGEVWVNTMYASLDAYPADAAGWLALANAFNLAYNHAWLDSATAHLCLRQEVLLAGCTVRDVAVEDGAEGMSNNGPFAGETTTGSLMANEVALCVSWHTGLSGRSFRGRMYLPGLTDAWLADANHISATHQSEAQDSADLFRAQIEAITEAPTPVIASYHHDHAPRDLAVVTPIISSQVNPRIDSQRRRMPRL